MVRLSKYWFNPLYFYIKYFLNKPEVRKVLTYGGSSASKTFSIAQALSIDSFNNNYNVISFRKEQANIKDSLKATFKQAIKSVGYQNVYDIQEFKIVSHRNFIRLRGLDNEDKIKGIEDYVKAHMNELDQYSFDEWGQVNKRLRGRENQQIFGDWNPVDERHWIKTEVIDKDVWQDLDIEKELAKEFGVDDYFVQLNYKPQINKSGNTVLLKTNYKDNRWITGGQFNGKTFGFYDGHTLDYFNLIKETNPKEYIVYALGEWGKPQTGDNFVTVEYKKEVRELQKSDWVVLSFDNNYNPMVCSIIFLNWEKIKIHFHKTIKKANTEIAPFCDYLMVELKKEFPDLDYRRIKITGDPNMRNRTASSMESMFGTIAKKFNLPKRQFDLVGHISHADHRNYFNQCLSLLEVTVNPNNIDLIYDFDHVSMVEKITSDGEVKLQINKNRTTSDKEADALDTARYAMQAYMYKHLK